MINPYTPTKEQLEICFCTDPRLIVEANAGAAKTTTLALKIRSFIEQGGEPRKILALCYSEAGVLALRRALKRVGLTAVVISEIKVGTFENFSAARLKRVDGVEVDRLTTPEQVRPHVLAAIENARSWAEQRFPGEFSITDSGELAVEELLNQFEHVKGTLQLKREADYHRLSPSGASELGRDFTTLAVLRTYEDQRYPFVEGERRASFRYLGDSTYDLACELIADEPRFLIETHPLRLNLQAVLVDEMHDMNWSMFTVLRHLLEINEEAIFVGVGDHDQVIYQKHGADHYFMGQGFDRELGQVRRLPLSLTFRFGRTLAQPLAAFAQKEYLTKDYVESHVNVLKCDSPKELLGVIRASLTSRSGLSQGSPKSQLVVLLRNPARAADLEHEMRKSDLRYESVGFTTYLMRPEILFARTILMTAVGLEEKFTSGVMTQAKRAVWAFIGGTLRSTDERDDPTQSRIETSTHENFMSYVIPGLLKTAESQVREKVLLAMDLASSDQIELLEKALQTLGIERLARRLLVTKQAIDDSGASLSALARAGAGYTSISSFLKSLLTFDYEAVSAKHADDRIIVSSIEAAKGLEFEHVILPDVNIGVFDGPSIDERNLFYVAASRAKNMLTMTHSSRGASSYLSGYLGPETRP